MSGWEDDTLNDVYDKTGGYCHICDKKMAFTNYGMPGARGSWQVDHSRPKARGGTDHFNNLYAICPECNLKKGTKSTGTARGWFR